MKSVLINGAESGIQGDSMPSMADFIELIKTTIDPDHMITRILVDGRELEEDDWSASTSRFETSVIEIETGLPSDYVNDRMAAAFAVVAACADGFQSARQCFQDGAMQDGNKKLVEAVNTLQAFFQWYGTMVQLVPQERRSEYNIDMLVEDLSEVCRKICQQQLYQSWWALGETLEHDLDPKLNALAEHVSKWAPSAEAQP